MTETTNKLEKMLEVSDDILNCIENSSISFEQVLLKCKKLARMRDDFDALKWFTIELSGYGNDISVSGISVEEKEKFAGLSGRFTTTTDPDTKEDVHKYWTASVSEIESNIQTNLINLQNTVPPTNFTPVVTKHSYESYYTGPTTNEHVVEKYQDVLNNVQTKRGQLTRSITQSQSLLSKIKDNVYNYVLRINLQLRFENTTESIFQTTKTTVDKKLDSICPEAMKKFIAAYNRLSSDDREEWSQAMSSCRNVLKEFADFVFPAQKEKYKNSSGESLAVTDDKYKNRLIAFIDQNTSGDKGKFTKARLNDLISRVHILNDLLSKGTHVGLDLQDVNICVIDTYMLIGSLLNLVQEREP
jgi:hypothetical protein